MLSLYLARMPGVAWVTSSLWKLELREVYKIYGIKVNFSRVLLLLLFWNLSFSLLSSYPLNVHPSHWMWTFSLPNLVWDLRVDYIDLSTVTETFRCRYLASPALFRTLLCICVFIFIHSVCARVAYVCMNVNGMFHNVHVELRGQSSGASSHLPPHRGRVSLVSAAVLLCAPS